MSVVAAKVLEDKVVMAADSILVKGCSKRNSNFAKIAGINGMIVGGVGYAQEISLMWHYMQTHKPASPTEKDVLSFIVELNNLSKEPQTFLPLPDLLCFRHRAENMKDIDGRKKCRGGKQSILEGGHTTKTRMSVTQSLLGKNPIHMSAKGRASFILTKHICWI